LKSGKAVPYDSPRHIHERKERSVAWKVTPKADSESVSRKSRAERRSSEDSDGKDTKTVKFDMDGPASVPSRMSAEAGGLNALLRSIIPGVPEETHPLSLRATRLGSSKSSQKT
jgi:hypothetical protein